MRTVVAVAVAAGLFAVSPVARGQDLSSKEVLASIEAGKQYLVSRQNADGSWSNNYGKIGPSSLAVLSLINAGMPTGEAPVRRGLEFLRSVQDKDFNGAQQTYETSLVIMALTAAKDPRRDRARLMSLTDRLERGQIVKGPGAGLWTYSLGGGLGVFTGGDGSNGQFAVLGLREAVFAGIPVERSTWENIGRHWLTNQNADGGWDYGPHGGMGSYGSMTVAGITTLNIIKTVLREDDLQKDGTPDCCGRDKLADQVDEALERAYRWMQTRFAVSHNPGVGGNILYYLYGLERAGRLSGRRFFGEHDWYREGAEWLIAQQTPRDGGWRGVGNGEGDPIIGTSFALLFLSKGLSPVLINKLKFGPEPKGRVVGEAWNLHPNDARNLTEFVSTRPDWPKLVTWQVLELPKVVENGSVGDLLQAPVLYITGRDGPPELSDTEAELLRSYVDQGGFIFAVAGCDRAAWDDAMRAFISKLYPNGEGELKRLGADHPIYRAEFLFEDPDAIELWGVDVGCRTAVVYSPDDLGCLWEYWLPFDPPKRSPKLIGMVTQKLRVGVNVVAYATGREPPSKLDVETDPVDDGMTDPVERGLLQIAKLRHSGNWDAAPRALRNLLVALNETAGLAASTKKNTLVATDPDLYKYPIVYMHGRTAFTLSPREIERLREHLDRGAVLFADACCGSPAFDASFRSLVKSLYPDDDFQRIPPSHELFSTAIGHDLAQVRRRVPGVGDGPLAANVQVGEPFLEGVEIEGRYPVIYSKYDISCALEKQSSAACSGYLPEDALKIAINVVLYAMLQDVTFVEGK
ncbi:MAG: DUF4159 domain-containing protein [Planctomycetaceae bacterium]